MDAFVMLQELLEQEQFELIFPERSISGQPDIRLVYLMNDAVDLARDVCRPPENYDQDLSAMLKALITRGVSVKVCGTCMARCGIYKNHPYFDGAEQSTMPALVEWVTDSDKVITF